MGLLNKDTDNAVKALLHIATHESDRLSTKDLASDLDISYPFLRKIFLRLSQEGIVNSFKGKGGGFELSLPPEEIFISDLVGIFQGSLKLTNCSRHDRECRDIRTCPLRKKILAYQKDLVDDFRTTSLADLLNDAISCGADSSNAVN